MKYNNDFSDGYDAGVKVTKEIDERKIGRLKKFILKETIVLSGITLGVGTLAAYLGYKAGQKNTEQIVIENLAEEEKNDEEIKQRLEGLEKIDSIEHADIEILKSWIGSTPKDAQNENAKNSSIDFNKIYFEYQEALNTPLYGYVPTNLNHDPERDGYMEESHYSYEEEISKLKNKLISAAKEFEDATGNKFVSSIFRYAYVNEDNIVMVPCAKELSGVNLPEDFEVKTVNGNSYVYVPYSSKDKENIDVLSK